MGFHDDARAQRRPVADDGIGTDINALAERYIFADHGGRVNPGLALNRRQGEMRHRRGERLVGRVDAHENARLGCRASVVVRHENSRRAGGFHLARILGVGEEGEVTRQCVME